MCEGIQNLLRDIWLDALDTERFRWKRKRRPSLDDYDEGVGAFLWGELPEGCDGYEFDTGDGW